MMAAGDMSSYDETDMTAEEFDSAFQRGEKGMTVASRTEYEAGPGIVLSIAAAWDVDLQLWPATAAELFRCEIRDVPQTLLWAPGKVLDRT